MDQYIQYIILAFVTIIGLICVIVCFNNHRKELIIISKNISDCDDINKLLELNAMRDFFIEDENSNICWKNNFKTRLLFDLINEKTKLNYNLKLESDSFMIAHAQYHLLYLAIKKYYEDKDIEDENNQYNSFKQKYLSEN